MELDLARASVGQFAVDLNDCLPKGEVGKVDPSHGNAWEDGLGVILFKFPEHDRQREHRDQRSEIQHEKDLPAGLEAPGGRSDFDRLCLFIHNLLPVKQRARLP